MLKKFPSDKINVTKTALFFLSRALTHCSFTFNLQFSYKLNKRLISLNLSVGFSILFRLYQNLYFFSMKSMDSLTLKHHNSFQNKSNKKVIHSFAPRPLTFKLQQEFWKFNDICVSWSSLKVNIEQTF